MKKHVGCSCRWEDIWKIHRSSFSTGSGTRESSVFREVPACDVTQAGSHVRDWLLGKVWCTSGGRVSGQCVNLGLSGNQLLAPHPKNFPGEQILPGLLCLPVSLIFNCTYPTLARGVNAQQFLKSPSSPLCILLCSRLYLLSLATQSFLTYIKRTENTWCWGKL